MNDVKGGRGVAAERKKFGEKKEEREILRKTRKNRKTRKEIPWSEILL